MLRRIYYFKAGKPVNVHGGENPVRMLGTNCSWTDDTEPHPTSPHKLLINVKITNLVNSGHCVFLSVDKTEDSSWSIDEVIRELLGANYPSPGLYEF